MLRLPTIQGLIRRRILVNFRADATTIQQHLPSRFRPKLHNGYAIVGICLIRLEHIRPKPLPAWVGLHSENAAHRIAVEWNDSSGQRREGVFIPRRDSSSQLNHLLGGRVVSGEHHRASFSVRDTLHSVDLAMYSHDTAVQIRVVGNTARNLPPSSVFESVQAASAFFETGALGYSVTREASRFDGLILATQHWQVEPLDIHTISSSYFADEDRFPHGTIAFDHALIMRDIPHQWHNAPSMYT